MKYYRNKRYRKPNGPVFPLLPAAEHYTRVYSGVARVLAVSLPPISEPEPAAAATDFSFIKITKR